MQAKSNKFRVFVLLLGLTLLAAQFHFCADTASGASAKHVCPYCSEAGAALLSDAPQIAAARSEARLECIGTTLELSNIPLSATSPRAPPAL